MALDQIPYELNAKGIVLRSYDPRDESHARMLFSAIDESRAHLGTYMAWADAHRTLADSAAWIRMARGRFESLTDFSFGIFAADDGRFLGGTGMHVRGEPAPVAIEIGYWLRASETGKGFALETARAIAKACFELVRAQRVVIRAVVANTKSRRIPETLGFEFEGIARHGTRIREQAYDLAMYSMLPDEASRLDA